MATITCRNTKTVYFAVPRNGSTTLRNLYFKIENGFEFSGFDIDGKPVKLFWHYRHHQPFSRIGVPEGYSKIAVVRNPLTRFISSYKRLAADWKSHFRETPEIGKFIARLEEFVKRSPKARFHLAPQSAHLGGDLSYFDKIFRLENLSEMADYLAQRSGMKIQLPWSNKSVDLDAIVSDAEMEKIIKIYRNDYDLLREYYKP